VIKIITKVTYLSSPEFTINTAQNTLTENLAQTIMCMTLSTHRNDIDHSLLIFSDRYLM